MYEECMKTVSFPYVECMVNVCQVYGICMRHLWKIRHTSCTLPLHSLHTTIIRFPSPQYLLAKPCVQASHSAAIEAQKGNYIPLVFRYINFLQKRMYFKNIANSILTLTINNVTFTKTTSLYFYSLIIFEL